MNYNEKQLIDFIYELNNDNEYASFPRKTSREKISAEVQRLQDRENYKLILDFDEDKLNAVCIYYIIEEEKYVQTSVFLIKENYRQTAAGFLNEIQNGYPDYKLNTGFPKTNIRASKFFENDNFECVDSSSVTCMDVINSDNRYSNDKIITIDKDNFDAYADFHDFYAVPLQMFYNSDNLKKELSRFRIFAYQDKEEIKGSIFVKFIDHNFEVFGLFTDAKLESVLIDEMLVRISREFPNIAEILYFIEDESTRELEAAINAGFRIKDSYRCYRKIL